MRDARCSYITGFNPSGEFRFEGSIPAGRGKQRVGIIVHKNKILALAAALAHTDSVGHATWHVDNPASPLPCSSCSKEAS